MQKTREYECDRRTKRIFGIVALSLTVLAAGSTLLIKSTAFEPYVYLFWMAAFPVLVFCWAGWLECTLYIRRLKKWGIDTPRSKKGQSIPLVDAESLPGEGKICISSLALSVIAFGVSIGCFAYCVWLVLKYGSLGMFHDVCGAAVMLGLPSLLVWGIIGCLFFHQRRNDLYRHAADPISIKKVRFRPVRSAAVMCILILITWFVLSTARTMTDYVYKSRLEKAWGEQWHSHVGEPVPGDYR